jgi:hypothetical protein
LSRKSKRKTHSDLADDFCDAVKRLTADRASRTYAAQW